MKVAVEELESCKRRLAVEAPLDIVQKEWEKAYGRVQKRGQACPASGRATCRARWSSCTSPTTCAMRSPST